MSTILWNLFPEHKEHIPRNKLQDAPMLRRAAPQTINEVLAENLAAWMIKRGYTSDPPLAKKAGVDTKTVWNCKNPEKRLSSGEAALKGKQPSITLTNLDRIASALEIPVWVLLRPASANDADFTVSAGQVLKPLRSVRHGKTPGAI